MTGGAGTAIMGPRIRRLVDERRWSAMPASARTGGDTAIQAAAVERDLGVFDDPDSFYRTCGSNFSGARGWIFRHAIRPRMNRRVAAIRALASTAALPASGEAVVLALTAR